MSKEEQDEGKKDLDYLHSLLEDKDRGRITLNEYFENYDKTNYEKKMEGKIDDYDEYFDKLYEFDYLDMEDISSNIEVLRYIDHFRTEVIDFEMFAKICKDGKDIYRLIIYN